MYKSHENTQSRLYNATTSGHWLRTVRRVTREDLTFILVVGRKPGIQAKKYLDTIANQHVEEHIKYATHNEDMQVSVPQEDPNA